MFVPRTIDDLKRLIHDGVEEGQQLEYKAAPALQDTEAKEIGKDVSAMANASGGMIIYGISEHSTNTHLPEGISPIDRNSFSKERLEQIINSNISPRIEGVLIHPIPLEKSNQVVYVVEIPQGETAHQNTRDLRYYRRYNFEVLAMHDYEIRDIMNRLKHPRIEMHFELQKKDHVTQGAPTFGVGPMPGRIKKTNDTVHTTLTLKLWPVNTGSQYAKFVNYFVDIPEDIVESEAMKSLTKVSDSEVQHYGENTFRDVVGVTPSIYGATPNYGPSRFDPILPTLGGRSETIELKPEARFEAKEIKWRVHADNAPENSGSIKLIDITLTYDSDQ